jgi:hypothetical protein
VHERGGLKRVFPSLPPEVAPGDTSQLSIDKRDQYCLGLAISAFQLLQQLSYLTGERLILAVMNVLHESSFLGALSRF